MLLTYHVAISVWIMLSYPRANVCCQMEFAQKPFSAPSMPQTHTCHNKRCTIDQKLAHDIRSAIRFGDIIKNACTWYKSHMVNMLHTHQTQQATWSCGEQMQDIWTVRTCLCSSYQMHIIIVNNNIIHTFRISGMVYVMNVYTFYWNRYMKWTLEWGTQSKHYTNKISNVFLYSNLKTSPLQITSKMVLSDTSYKKEQPKASGYHMTLYHAHIVQCLRRTRCRHDENNFPHMRTSFQRKQCFYTHSRHKVVRTTEFYLVTNCCVLLYIEIPISRWTFLSCCCAAQRRVDGYFSFVRFIVTLERARRTLCRSTNVDDVHALNMSRDAAFRRQFRTRRSNKRSVNCD